MTKTKKELLFYESRHVWAISAGIAYFSWMWHFPGEIGRPNAPKCRSQKVGILKCKSRADRSKPVGLLVFPSAACSAMAARRFDRPDRLNRGNYRDFFSDRKNWPRTHPNLKGPFIAKIGTHSLVSLGSKGENRNPLACLRNAGSYSAESYCVPSASVLIRQSNTLG